MPATVYFDVKSIQELRRSSGDSISTADRMKSSRVHDLQSEVAPMKPDEKGKMKRRDSWGTAVYAVLNGSHPGTLCVCVFERECHSRIRLEKSTLISKHRCVRVTSASFGCESWRDRNCSRLQLVFCRKTCSKVTSGWIPQFCG